MATDSHDRFGSGPDLPGAVVEDILGSERRRRLLTCLADHGGEMTVTDLAASVCGREQDVPPEEVSVQDRQAVYEDIYERHLPKLTATGTVRFDSLRDAVELVRRDVLADAESP